MVRYKVRLKYKEALAARGMSIRAFTRLAGIERSNLSKLERSNMLLSSIISLAEKIGEHTGKPCHPSEIYEIYSEPAA